jgi:hypothetical protein
MPLSTGDRGAGAMGKVYKVRDTRLDRVVAIKVPTSLCPDESIGRKAASKGENRCKAVILLITLLDPVHEWDHAKAP